MHQIAGTRLIKLAHRSSADVDVSLFWVEGDGDDKAVVCVRDTREGDYFEIPTERYLALDVYTRSRIEISAPLRTYIAADAVDPGSRLGDCPQGLT
jgi:hypothetical protein